MLVKSPPERRLSLPAGVLSLALLAALALAGCTGPTPTPEPTALPGSVGTGPSVTSDGPGPTAPATAATPVPAVAPAPISTPVLAPASTAVPAPEPVATPAPPEPTAAPTPTAVPTPTPLPTPTPVPMPTAVPTPTPTAVPAPTKTPAPVAIPVSLTGAPRIQGPLFSYEDEQVYNEVRSLVSDQGTFVADFYRELAKEEEGNLFYSPYSLYTALAVVYAGAGGNTAAQFQDVMGINLSPGQFHRNMNSLDLTLLDDSVRPGEPGSERPESPPVLSVANGLWIQDGLEVRPEFLNTVTANYGIGLQQLDFRQSPNAAVTAINDWVEEATQGKIQDAISRDSIAEFTSLAVTNAVYFKGDWQDQFEEEYTADEPFYLLNGQAVLAPMMFQRNHYGYRLGEGYTAVALPYRGHDFDLLVVMPDEGTFDAFEESLTGDRLRAITEDLGGGQVILRMPRFKLEHSFSAKKSLKALGMGEAFARDRADFNPLASSLFGWPIEALWLEDALQKAFIEVNEEGSEAAAATIIIGGATATSVPPPPVEITVDRPFIFLLRHSPTGAVLFMGRVLNPDPEATVISRDAIPPTPTPRPPGPTEPPMILIGIATLNGQVVPPDTTITAFDGDKEVGSVKAKDGGAFTLQIKRSEGPVTFKVDGHAALESAPEWISGTITRGFNLTAGEGR